MQRAGSGRPGRRPLSVRGARQTRRRPTGNHKVRIGVGRLLMVAALIAAGVKLVVVQGFEADALAARAESQRTTPQPIPAARGAILDRNNRQLAFSVESRVLYVIPSQLKKNWDDLVGKHQQPAGATFESMTADMAAFVHKVIGDESYGEKLDEPKMLEKLRSGDPYAELVQNVDPAKARVITEKWGGEIGADPRAVRLYPNGDLASNIIGAANWRKETKPPATHGILGLENSEDNTLAGRNGRRVVDTALGKDGVVIPGTERDLDPATPGSSLQLTIDTDTQYEAQRLLTDYKNRSGAKSASMVVMDARTSEIYALVNDKTYDPSNFGEASEDQRNNIAVTSPFEPGSVNKIVTASAAIEDGVVKPDTVIRVPGSIPVADVTVRDAWPHGPVDMTFTGVLAKSSNVGTLLTAQKVGEDKFAAMLNKFGLGQSTGSGLPGEAAGIVPPQGQWSGSTFGNLPIGQGLTMNLLQMAGMYQTIANDGLRVPPKIIRSEVGPDGTSKEPQRPDSVRVVSPETAKTVRDMLRATMQKVPTDPNQNGTGSSAALPGYQIAGKTGTAQTVDPACGCYSNSSYNITFAGILPADSPRFVVGIALLNTAPLPGNPASVSAAPLFHQVASYLTQRYQIPLSNPAEVPPATLMP
ncbi:penicillin-binding protein 2 [Solihabitans fulvus]|uniref:Penicillin-binding protein 2 n=1 Tax=Solihabitans fulvus TaxID=1892852 RepID=A0A5B2X627_9PSEU|nr:penicillin-binding protein 2 [Solihabitans fulvus]KAA2258645.1 penicillin-binding protein 2 [Solihabitans fulvus]